MNTPLFSVLVGQTITSLSHDPQSVSIETTDRKYSIHHEQDCCEHVRIEKIIGDPKALAGLTITLAEEDSREPDFEHALSEYSESHTWTSFYLEAMKGTEKVRVEFWFLGESNGYYGETANFYEV